MVSAGAKKRKWLIVGWNSLEHEVTAKILLLKTREDMKSPEEPKSSRCAETYQIMLNLTVLYLNCLDNRHLHDTGCVYAIMMYTT